MGIEALLSTQIIDTTTVGRSVMTAVDAAAARTALGLGTLATQNGTITDYLTTAAATTTYQPLDADLTALAALTGTNNIYYRSAANTWSSVTIGTGLTFTGGTLAATASGGITGTTGATNNTMLFSTTTDGTIKATFNTGIYSGSLVVVDGLSGPQFRFAGGGAVGFERQSGDVLRCLGNYMVAANNNIQQQYYSINDLTLGAVDGGCFVVGAGNNSTSRGFWRGAAGFHVQGGSFGLTTASSFYVYNTWTSWTSYERTGFSWSGNVCTLTTEKGSAGGTLRGLRIGDSATALLGFFGATAIVQPGTGVASATRVGGGGTALTDTDTFDGYTIGQVVKALRNLGFLA